jgi:hypothetical protein
MNKKSVIEGLRQAREAHVNWVHHIRLMVYGFNIREDIPTNPTQSGFGKWFYGEAQQLKELRNTKLECMSHVEKSHLETHAIYFKIYELIFKNRSEGLLDTLLGSELSPEQLQIAKEHFEDLENASKELLSNTLRLEKRILALPDEELLLLGA